MKTTYFFFLLVGLTLGPLFSLHATSLPEFTSKSATLWINSQPLKASDLKGNVVLLEIWTST
jgi:hypothetical protein